MSAPRVLVSGVVLGQPAGGVRRHNAELLPRIARLLVARGGSLAVLEGRERIEFELPREIERLASTVPGGPPIARAAAEGHALRSAIASARAAGRPFDLVHTAHFPVPRSLALPFTLTIHDLRALSLASAPLTRRLVAGSVIGGAARRAARVFTVSHTTAREIAARLRVEDAIVIGNGGDHFAPRPRAAGAGAPLVHLGHLEPRKNLDVLVAALARDASLPALELWGAAKADEADRLAGIAAKQGVSARVRFRGPYADAELATILAGCAAVVLPSRLEGFGIAVLEAQRARAPLAIADAGALPEVAGPDTPRFDPDDAGACAAAIRRALESRPADLDRAAAHAASFTWDRSAQVWCEGWCALG
ncbi:MAG: glycosyltransferase family 1 protein [Planctomycetota bacterium]|nr:glycosyltransferase family 1 protein [Planctomycetota bacterium]